MYTLYLIVVLYLICQGASVPTSRVADASKLDAIGQCTRDANAEMIFGYSHASNVPTDTCSPTDFEAVHAKRTKRDCGCGAVYNRKRRYAATDHSYEAKDRQNEINGIEIPKYSKNQNIAKEKAIDSAFRSTQRI